MERTPIIIDINTDGNYREVIDFIRKSETLDLKMVVSTYGEKDVYSNAEILREYTSGDVKVCTGTMCPLLSCDGIINVPDQRIQEESFCNAVSNVVKECNEKIWYVCFRSLSNAAVLISSEPELKERLGGIVFAGGAPYEGNITAGGDRNVMCDIESAAVVISSKTNFVMVPFNRESDSGMLALEWIISPQNFLVRLANVEIDMCGRYTRGNTVVDFEPTVSRKRTNVTIVEAQIHKN